MKEIKIHIGKGGKVKILAKGVAGQGTEQLTEKLAKDLGNIEERHKGHSFDSNTNQNQVEQH